ncbi:thiol reductant ABC exporter subunit CydC [Robertmurraya massiliosenegalensis]|uniref:thiol reductant ABC exporter subunit CydC n=1 Tax=Robertmurraya massiliosenegalensis TaxID=1287657 RepID=UPI000381919E|nr:thiol reductant ABC exporter subunit CydC [Robertmurraya massiliosenegalensis]
MKYFQVYVKPYLKQYSHWIALAILFGVMTVVGSSMLTFTSGYLISSAALQPYNILMLYVPIVLVRTFGISQAVTRYIERLIGHNTVLRILSIMRVSLYRVIEPQALFIRSRFQAGDLLGTLADDIEHLQDVFIRTIFPVIVALFLFASSVVALSLFDWKFALWIGFCLSFVVFVYPLLSLFLMKNNQLKLKESKSNLYTTLTDTIFGLTDWLIRGGQEQFLEKFAKESEQMAQVERKMSYWNQSRELHLRILSCMILIMVGIWAGLAVDAGEIASTYIAAFTLVTLPIIEGLIPVSRAVEKIPTYQESLKRIEMIESNGFEEKYSNVSLGKEADIFVNGLKYRYRGSIEDTIKGIDLSISPGAKVALLGKSGAGKSTLLQILLGELIPTKGQVLINGFAPSDYGEDIYQMISVLNQKPYLFATTVENNICLGNEDATEEEIERVIRQVKLDQYIHSLPKGLATQMGETGALFSGGERQRIALARILLKDTPIVILDEPTVGLDPRIEADLIETIFTTLKDKTVIWVTHHLLGMEKIDQILFMEKGKIALEGNHQLLMKTSERYRSLYELDKG